MQFTQKSTPDTRICEICGTEFLTGYGYSIAACWLVTGHAHVAGFMCESVPGGQHWGCTPEHAIEALQACLSHPEHMHIDKLKAKHEAAEADGKPRTAEEDKEMVSGWLWDKAHHERT